MSLRDHLNLSVTVARVTVSIDGYGNASSSTVSTVIPRATIWSPGQGDRRISDKIAKTSTHVLVIETGAYTFADADATVTCDGVVYKLIGHPDDVASQGHMTLHGMERIS